MLKMYVSSFIIFQIKVQRNFFTNTWTDNRTILLSFVTKLATKKYENKVISVTEVFIFNYLYVHFGQSVYAFNYNVLNNLLILL